VFKRKLSRIVALPLVLLLPLAGVSLWQIKLLLSAMERVNHTDRVIARANQMQKLLLDIETGGRGYVLSGEKEFLEPYENAIAVIEPTLSELKYLISDNASQEKRIAQIESRYRQWNDSTPSLFAFQGQAIDKFLPILKERKRQMDALREEISVFIASEEQLRNQRSEMVREKTQLVIGSSIFSAIAIGSCLAYFTRREVTEISRSYENALKVARQEKETSENLAGRLLVLHEIDRKILLAQSLETLAQEILDYLIPSGVEKKGTIVLFDDRTQKARILAGDELAKEISDCISLDLASEREQTLLIRDISSLPARSPALEQLLERGYRSLLSLAMFVEDKQIGDLCLFATQPDAFSDEETEIAREVADQLAIAIQQAQLRSQLQQYTQELEERVKERTQQLEESNQELEAFSYSVSHDLQAPLRAIEGFAQILIEDYSDRLDEMGHEYTRRIVAAASRLDRLIQDLLAYARLGRAEIARQRVDLTLVVREVLDELEPDLKATNARIVVESPFPLVLGHYNVLKQVLTNLLSNAIKFVVPDVQPQVRVWAEKRGTFIRFWVEDNGIGIAPQHQERIFKSFERLHGIETYAGTGIGLAIVKRGIERLGGRVGVESGIQQGSRFWLELEKASN
jgi:signal transduction histidine kinase/CHASE3 domain sensor protein